MGAHTPLMFIRSVGVNAGVPQSSGHDGLQRHGFADRAPQEVRDPRHQLVRVDRLRRQGLLKRERKPPLGQMGQHGTGEHQSRHRRNVSGNRPEARPALPGRVRTPLRLWTQSRRNDAAPYMAGRGTMCRRAVIAQGKQSAARNAVAAKTRIGRCRTVGASIHPSRVLDAYISMIESGNVAPTGCHPAARVFSVPVPRRELPQQQYIANIWTMLQRNCHTGIKFRQHPQ